MLTLPDLLVDPHIEYRGVISEVTHPTLGQIKQVATPINVDGRLPAARWFEVPGAHTTELLGEVGLDHDAQQQLYERGAIFITSGADSRAP